MAYAYASAPDVVGHLTLVATFTATSRPNASQVHNHLLDTAAELNSKLAEADYSVPVSTAASAAFEQLNHFNAIGAAMYTTAAHPAGKDSKHLEFLERRWNAILSGIADGSISLDAEQDTSVSLPRFGRSDPLAAGASPYFTRDFSQGI